MKDRQIFGLYWYCLEKKMQNKNAYGNAIRTGLIGKQLHEKTKKITKIHELIKI